MNKFLAVVKREYLQRVRSKMFIVATILGPFVMSLFGVIPALILRIQAGGPVRIAIVDQTGKMYRSVSLSLLNEVTETQEPPPTPINGNTLNANSSQRFQQAGNPQEESFELEEVRLAGRSIQQVKMDLSERVRRKEIDGYLILPSNLLQEGQPEFFGRNTGDFQTAERLKSGLSRAVREERFTEAGIRSEVVHNLSKPVALQSYKIGEVGAEHDSGEGFILVFATGFIIYLTILMYGQLILGAVIEEKETRIAEILFSSVRPFPLMMGKLIGISLIALTQLAVWGLAFLALTLGGVGLLASKGPPVHIPHIAPIIYFYFVLFFLLGYFTYATIHVLVGSMVTTAQEGGQLAMPIILVLVVGFCLAFPVIRSPDSSFAFWVSMFPFFSPIVMLVRIVTQTPPVWQILSSLGIGAATVVLLLWLAARIYRVGMLMYGKKATIPEVMRWVRQA